MTPSGTAKIHENDEPALQNATLAGEALQAVAVEQAAQAPPAHTFGPVYRGALLILIMLAAAFAYIDRVIIQTLAQPIKDDLGLSDFQLGLLGGLGFAILYSTLGLPIARMAERRDRITIVSVSIAVFSAFSLLCGVAANFWQLFLCRIGVGIGEAGVQAPSTSLIGDHFPPHRRGFAITIMRLGAPMGAIFGSVLSAWIAKDHGWRMALMAICGPGLLIALLFRLILRDPPRGLSDSHPASGIAGASQPPSMREIFALMVGKPVFRHMLIGLALATMGLYAAGAFTAPFYMRVHQLSLAEASVYLAIISTAAATAGMSLGGFGIDFLAKRGTTWYAMLPFWGLVISVPLHLLGYDLDNAKITLVLLTLAASLVFLHAVPTLVAFQNMVAPTIRTTAAFVFFFVSTLFGLGLGPPLIGLLSDAYATAAMPGFSEACVPAPTLSDCAAASAIGVRSALLTSVGLFAWAAVHYWLAARAIAAESRDPVGGA